MTTLIGAKTHFSLSESIYNPKQLIEDAHQAGWEALCISDIHCINTLPTLFAEAKARGMKAIIGISVTVVDDVGWRKAKRGEKKVPNPFWMPSLYATNEAGVKDLFGLLTLASSEDRFYMKPQISMDDLYAVAQRGNVIVTTGNTFSLFSHKRAHEYAQKLASACSANQLVCELTPVNSIYHDRISFEAIKYIALNPGTPFVLSRPVLNPKGQVDIRNTLNCILSRDQIDSMWRREPATDLHVLTWDELNQEASAQCQRLQREGWLGPARKSLLDKIYRRAVLHTAAFVDRFEYEWDKYEASLPDMAADPFKELFNLTKAGWKRRINSSVLGYQPPADKLPEYKARLQYELGTLKNMGFENYFLLVEKLVSWCRENKVMVGPGRGSVGGSLVAFLLGITDVDPIRFGLIFERFINPDRIDLPDIDLDFMSSRRGEVVDHLIEVYGKDCVAGISNYGMLASSSALRSVGSAHGLTEFDYRCSKLVPKDSGTPVKLELALEQVPEIEKFAIEHPQVWREACDLQGTFRSHGRHAAGIVVAGEPIANRAAVEDRQGHRTINWDKRSVEDFGLIKLDILGLSNLDVLQLALDYIEEGTGARPSLVELPLDDPKVLEAFAKGRTVGIFQYESNGMKHLLKQLAAGDRFGFEDLCAATALYRPGPMQSGLMDTYISIRQGASMEDYPHPAMRPALEETVSVIVYQEQVMQIARDIAGFTMAESDILRKIMGKKDPEKMALQRDKWVDGCIEHSGMTKQVATSLFDQVEKFAGYGFNKSHSYQYTIISWWTMWLKVYHPDAFYAAALTVLGDEKVPGLVRDAEAHDLHVVPPDINYSTDRYEIGYDQKRCQKILYAPLQAVKGLSEKGAAAILKAQKVKGQPFESKADFIATVDRRSCNIRVQDSLDKVGAFARIEPGQLDPRHPDRLRDQKELLPGLMLASVKAERKIEVSPHVEAELNKLMDACENCGGCSLAGTMHPVPRLGRSPKVMIVMDSPHWGETEAGKMGEGDASRQLRIAMKSANLTMRDVYLTSLVKGDRGKGVPISNEMINGCSEHLTREIELLNPPVIVALGTKTVRHLLPDLKGSWEELIGQEVYDPKHDATVVCGLNPAMIYHRPSMQGALNEVMQHVATILE